MRECLVPQEQHRRRADTAIAAMLGISRAAAVQLLNAGGVQLSGPATGQRALTKGSVLQAGQILLVEEVPQAATRVSPRFAHLTVLYDDPDCVVIDKPVGVAAHVSAGWLGPTVLGSLQAMGYSIATSGAQERQGIVHRLDVGTSGAMVVAKTEIAYSRLKRAFKERRVTKIYHACVQGLPEPHSGTIEAPIGRHPNHQWKFAVVTGGRPARTHYELLTSFGRACLLEVRLETGRTHQIRVHMAALRHPCVGDTMYGADPQLAAQLGLTRQWLHARQLGFEHPVTGKRIEITSPYPEDLEYALRALEQ